SAMFSKNSLPSPSLEDSFFPLSPSSSVSTDSGGGIETDLILAAELGRALLEKNEELAASLEQRERELEALQQEKHVLQRKLEMNELAFGQREAELTADLTTLRAEVEKHQSQGRDRRKDESEQMIQLANHNQRLVEQLAEAVTLEHSLRTELRTIRDEMEESSFSRNISFTQLENIQAENRVLQERRSHMETQLKASGEDNQRLRMERERFRDRLSEMQMKLKEKEAEIEQEQGVVFELRTLNRSLQQKALNLDEDSILDRTQAEPLSLLSEIQQSQVPTETHPPSNSTQHPINSAQQYNFHMSLKLILNTTKSKCGYNQPNVVKVFCLFNLQQTFGFTDVTLFHVVVHQQSFLDQEQSFGHLVFFDPVQQFRLYN
uniref:BICD family-like cargo adapter 2 n=1 Tax=Astatotilapia calliptera TaxID=8154 RepID=A0A3P8QKJ7_ASTCA